MNYSIAIDGPAGAGKSTIAKLLAKKMSYIYVDTGAMYRAMAIYFLDNNIADTDEAAVNEAVDRVGVSIEYEAGMQQVILNGENVTSRLRKEEVGVMASKTSVYPKVRLKLVELQRQLALTNNVIMDGRDIGTYVLKDATLKVYLTASVSARAKRRYDELKAKNQECNLEDICKDIEDRDYRDTTREFAPLKQAEDAIYLDSSDMTIEQVVCEIESLFLEKMSK